MYNNKCFDTEANDGEISITIAGISQYEDHSDNCIDLRLLLIIFIPSDDAPPDHFSADDPLFARRDPLV